MGIGVSATIPAHSGGVALHPRRRRHFTQHGGQDVERLPVRILLIQASGMLVLVRVRGRLHGHGGGGTDGMGEAPAIKIDDDDDDSLRPLQLLPTPPGSGCDGVDVKMSSPALDANDRWVGEKWPVSDSPLRCASFAARKSINPPLLFLDGGLEGEPSAYPSQIVPDPPETRSRSRTGAAGRSFRGAAAAAVT